MKQVHTIRTQLGDKAMTGRMKTNKQHMATKTKCDRNSKQIIDCVLHAEECDMYTEREFNVRDSNEHSEDILD